MKRLDIPNLDESDFEGLSASTFTDLEKHPGWIFLMKFADNELYRLMTELVGIPGNATVENIGISRIANAAQVDIWNMIKGFVPFVINMIQDDKEAEETSDARKED